MNTTRLLAATCFIAAILFKSFAQVSGRAQRLTLGRHSFELHHVTGSITRFQGGDVLKLERDLISLPFDSTRIQATADEPHYARLLGLNDFENGTIEVTMYSQLQQPKPYSGVAGFIGLYFRISQDDSAFDGIYVRPKVGRAANQLHRNHAVQYISYPQYKFDTLRKIAPFKYEGSAPVALNEWITMRIEVNGQTAEMYINNAKYSTFIVDQLLGINQKGGIGLYVDIGTIGYFKNLKVTKRALKARPKANEKVNKI